MQKILKRGNQRAHVRYDFMQIMTLLRYEIKYCRLKFQLIHHPGLKSMIDAI